MTHMNEEKIRILAGGAETAAYPMVPFSIETLDFLGEYARRLRKEKRALAFPDVLSFAFWCRRSSLERLREEQQCSLDTRLGRGTIFHIAPSNVPVNFAYSYAFGLLAGNANIVKVSSKNFKQVELMCEILQTMLEEDSYKKMKGYTKIITYEHDKEITDYYSSISQGRVIWGGDETVKEIRKSEIPPRCIEVVFADRYSLGMLAYGHILDMDGAALKNLAERFYNDTYLMDQNSCSAPHLILWTGAGAAYAAEERKAAKQKFWSAVYEAAEKYSLEDRKVSDKYEAACRMCAQQKEIGSLTRYENRLYVADLEQLPPDLTGLRGRYGMFFQYEIEGLESLKDKVTERVQTLAVEGLEAEKLRDTIIRERICGIDRIVPFGKTLDIGPVWDGYDMIGALSRIIATR